MKTWIEGGTLYVQCPYHPKWPAKARYLGGNHKTVEGVRYTWYFDARDEENVRDLLVELYGHDGRDYSDAPAVDVRVDVSHFGRKQQVFAFGDVLAERPGRDSRVKLMRDAVVIEGDFGSFGGSRKHPRLNADAIVEVRGIPLPVYRQTVLMYERKHETATAAGRSYPEPAEVLWLAEPADSQREWPVDKVVRSQLADAVGLALANGYTTEEIVEAVTGLAQQLGEA